MTLPRSLDLVPYKIVLYQAINLSNGKRYIGITSVGLRKRVERHFRTARFYKKGSVFGAAIRKYGQKNIKFSVLAVCPDWDYAKLLEVAAISAYAPEYNLTKGGDGCVGYRHSEEHKKRVSEWKMGAKSWLGKKHSVATKRKMSEAAKNRSGGPDRPIWVGEKEFKNLASAAREFGCTTANVYDAIKRNRLLRGHEIRYKYPVT